MPQRNPRPTPHQQMADNVKDRCIEQACRRIIMSMVTLVGRVLLLFASAHFQKSPHCCKEYASVYVKTRDVL